mgnify:CR=1 FL=1
MQSQKIIKHIVNWLDGYCTGAGMKGFVIGISGGIDSAVTSALCAKTGKPVICLNMPIYQSREQVARSNDHISWLSGKYKNVKGVTIELTKSFDIFKNSLPSEIHDELSLINARARLRMMTLYAFAGNKKMLVAGTGNKIEDFAIGFFTKYGDGGVDLSPIADLTKTEVYALAREMDIIESIQQAQPTDGLWGDDRTDEDQIGASYPELEWAMDFKGDESGLNTRQKEVLAIYNRLNKINQHKMLPVPVCEIPQGIKD